MLKKINDQILAIDQNPLKVDRISRSSSEMMRSRYR